MPILTASPALRAAAKARGLTLPPEPVELPPTEPAAPQLEPSSTSPSKAEKKRAWLAAQHEREKAARDRLWPLLSARFPAAFRLPPVPLAVGIHKQILEVAGDSIDPGELSAFMRYWTSRKTYRIAVWRGDPRRNLDGSEAGAPAIDQRNHAGISIWGGKYRPIPEDAVECPDQEPLRNAP
ncbi:MAG: hypothetical protein JO266_01700 [Acidobacteria bacterium]|nr:hypothetical protein [Acidobacteriota bacterium]